MSLNGSFVKLRGKNYTENEKELLLGLIKEYAYIIENQGLDGTTVRAKHRAWNEITTYFNTMINEQEPRTCYQLRSLYKNIKCRLKKESNVMDRSKRADCTIEDIEQIMTNNKVCSSNLKIINIESIMKTEAPDDDDSRSDETKQDESNGSIYSSRTEAARRPISNYLSPQTPELISSTATPPPTAGSENINVPTKERIPQTKIKKYRRFNVDQLRRIYWRKKIRNADLAHDFLVQKRALEIRILEKRLDVLDRI